MNSTETQSRNSVQRMVRPPLPLGTKTKWGEIGMVAMTNGERYYWCEDKNKVVSMMPARLVEESVA